MLPYAGRCPCRATTPRRAPRGGSPAAARSRRSPSCSRRPSPTPSRRASAASAASTPATATGASGAWPGCRTPSPPNPAGLFDANIFAPHRDTLAYSENNIVAGVLGLPAYLLTGNPYATHNLSMLLGIGLAFVGAYALARYLTRDTGASIVAAIGFAFCPFLFARTAHIQLMLFFGLPVAMLAMHRLVDAPSTGRGVALGLALAVQALACGYYGIFAGLLTALGLPFFAADARPLALGPLLGCAGRSRRPRPSARSSPSSCPTSACRTSWASPARSKRPPTTRPTSRPGWPRARGRTGGSCRGSAAGTRCSSPALLTLVGGLWGAAYAWRAAAPAAAPRRPAWRTRPAGHPGTCWRSTASAACSRSGSRSGRPPDSIGCCSR